MIFRKPSEIAVEERTATAIGYPAHLQFAKEAGGADDQLFWFHDGLHHPRPMRPLETIVPEAIKLGLSQANNRLFSFPMSNGIDQRIINGYIYFSPTGPDLKNTDLPRKFHPAAIRASAALNTPTGAVGATGGNAKLSSCAALEPV
ncbi:hypothetical protein HJB67_31655, partial [Rhizobium lentis]|nr:hypothetical protein [Rhizobium lentis]